VLFKKFVSAINYPALTSFSFLQEPYFIFRCSQSRKYVCSSAGKKAQTNYTIKHDNSVLKGKILFFVKTSTVKTIEIEIFPEII
jgi:hypothetical protein